MTAAGSSVSALKRFLDLHARHQSAHAVADEHPAAETRMTMPRV